MIPILGMILVTLDMDCVRKCLEANLCAKRNFNDERCLKAKKILRIIWMLKKIRLLNVDFLNLYSKNVLLGLTSSRVSQVLLRSNYEVI